MKIRWLFGYITGYSVFNSLKLTTQVPNVIQIAQNFEKKKSKEIFTPLNLYVNGTELQRIISHYSNCSIVFALSKVFPRQQLQIQ